MIVERGLVETVHVSDLGQDIGTELEELYLTGEICEVIFIMRWDMQQIWRSYSQSSIAMITSPA